MNQNRIPIYEFRISEEEIKSILDHLDEVESSVNHTNRRSVRHALRGAAMVVIVAEQGGYTAGFNVRMRNVSQHGFAFLSHRPSSEGVRLVVRLPIGKDGAEIERKATVRRCRHVRGMVYEIGAEFGDRTSQTSKKRTIDRIIE